MKKRNIGILTIVVILVMGGCGYLLYEFHCPRTGPHSGRVVHAITGEPVEGAVVSYVWCFAEIVFGSEMLVRRYETTTDPNGTYFVPVQRVIREHSILDGALHPESVLIYKDGYAVYTVQRVYNKPPFGGCYGYFDQQPYRKHGNLVKLYPWKEGESHEDHSNYIHWSKHGGGKLLIREMGRAKP